MSLELLDFKILEKGKYESYLNKNQISTFHELISFVQALPYGRNENRSDFSLIFKEKKGTCSSKHGLLQEIVEINSIQEIELMVGIFLMNRDFHPKVKAVLDKYNLEHIPEAHSFLRFQGQRFDFTSTKSELSKFEPFLVREQRCESQQLIDWKPMIHKHYIESWLKRKNLPFSPDEIWKIREECIAAM